MHPLLALDGLGVAFDTPLGPAPAVDSVSFALEKGESLGLVGESGCGKTVLSLAVLGLVPPPGRVTGGRILFEGRDLLTLGPEALRGVRGAGIGMVFQEPMTSLNPVMRVGFQTAEPLMLHKGLDKARALERAAELFAQVGLPDPGRVLRAYPHELSGGMRQRVMIAMALACEPRLLIADEPTTALDVTIQKQILELLASLARERGLSMLLISHNLGVVARTCARAGVMYAGRLVELSPVEALFERPLHPYSQGLLASLPRLGERHRLTPVAGAVPPIHGLPPGCHFHPRCPSAFEPCRREAPPAFAPEPGRAVRCWLHAPEARP
ncbi:Oligopeptide transport ATP-binding protein OppD [Fundidesulfovibrio magnetotacticus]|uniref:Oligopeptide transport ATP-binding protein OppD n=1 Tax=Fundidesulfovibrio magnetotacticus TaxID=2730080 RepID=A0A6V8LV04_9BACT|nr:ABC transporter ATP-binding protein [Fundidesulfovibrio magnetotacticus]GFK94790.1 Oligopeptide transport ATP-binding protein OppD [Fundidesulfovibrio magnetotacticus]